MTQELAFAALLIYILNLPFGYRRAGTEKISRQRYLAIHIPVPLVIPIRV